MRRLTAFVMATVMGITLGIGAWNANTIESRAASPSIRRNGYVKYSWNGGHVFVSKYKVGSYTAFDAKRTAAPPLSYMPYSKAILTNQNAKKVLYYGYGGPGKYFKSNSKKAYALTSLALSYFVSGASSLGGTDFDNSGLYEFIEYCQKQPNFKDGFKFGTKSVNATLTAEKRHQKTKNIKFIADARTKVTLSLPDHVTLHNVTTGISGQGKVTIRGGQSFYLRAPTSVKGTFSTGKIVNTAKTYQTYKLTMAKKGYRPIVYAVPKAATGSTSLKVSWLSQGIIQIQKVNSKTGKNISDASCSYKGAVYGIYKSEECTKASKVAAVKTNGKGLAASDPLPQGVYYVKETKASTGCGLDQKVHKVVLTSTSSKTFKKKITSKEPKLK